MPSLFCLQKKNIKSGILLGVTISHIFFRNTIPASVLTKKCVYTLLSFTYLDVTKKGSGKFNWKKKGNTADKRTS